MFLKFVLFTMNTIRYSKERASFGISTFFKYSWTVFRRKGLSPKS